MATKRRAASAGPRTAATRVEEVLLEGARLERAPGLAGDDHQRAIEVDAALERGDLRRDGRVEDVQLGRAGLASEGASQHLGTQAGAAHAEQQRVREAVPADAGGDVPERGQERAAGVDGAEPAEPPGFVGAGPERRVLVPQPARAAGAVPLLRRPAHLIGQRRGAPPGLRVHACCRVRHDTRQHIARPGRPVQ